MISKVLRNRRGYTLIQIIIAVFILVVITGGIMFGINQNNAKKEEAKVDTNIATLESNSRTYNSLKGNYPVKDAINIAQMPANNPIKMFYEEVVRLSGKHPDVISDRLKIIDLQPLLQEGYISSQIDDPEYYILDKRTGKVYFVKRKAKLEDLTELAKQLLADANDLTPGDPNFKTDGDNFDVEVVKNGTTYRMYNIIAMIQNGSKVIVGGGCAETKPTCTDAIKVAVITLSTLPDGTVKREIKDLTEEVQADRNYKSVTELVLVGKGKVLVHYADSAGKLSNKIINVGG